MQHSNKDLEAAGHYRPLTEENSKKEIHAEAEAINKIKHQTVNPKP